ncbi:putative Dual specificity phosphatase Cdc25 [Histomonas meleagridis]|uniref:putative Dual specificity phosphatase Cdc25 n=1 Tax=Histomonas meleagridis TaxID=135588 RepID=UPI0035598D1F|nr:putative Dual specificity phosphatase Cdc25 [Histomonas meleagridis]KAH0799146.1 putative Dual specificity phosphatase Cdc25 [Histomonas meleagridis]
MEQKPLGVVTAEELVSLIDTGKAMIIDSRDSDYGEGGVIKNSVHIPYFGLNFQGCKGIMERVEELGVDNVVTYCKYGQQRSVKMARRLVDFFAQYKPDSTTKISYLQYGLEGFLDKYQDTGYVIPHYF